MEITVVCYLDPIQVYRIKFYHRLSKSMEWTRVDDSKWNFGRRRPQLSTQGHAFERGVAYSVSKHIPRQFNCEILTRGFDKLKDHEGRRVLLVPNHRSYLDPLILHQALMLSGYKQPRVVALDFIAATPIAPLARKCGAVFIRDSFGDLTYREKMNQRLRDHADDGDWIEFYLEGQRSTSGKQLEPRTGLLKAMTADKPCAIYPINFSYERLIEDRDFISKRGFNIKHTAQSLLAPAKGIGQVHITVGDPILTEPGNDVRSLAGRITKEIMKTNTIYCTDLVATILLDRQEAVELETLQSEINWLSNAIEQRGVRVADRDLEETLKFLKHAVRYRKGTRKGVITIRDKTLLIYYRNRMLYTISDLASLPDMLRKEALWHPDHKPRGRDSKQLQLLAKRAFEPTIFLYKYLLSKIEEGTTSLKELRRSIEDSPHCCFETVTNLAAVLKEDGVVTVTGDTLTRL